jgi:hypothetical protein
MGDSCSDRRFGDREEAYMTHGLRFLLALAATVLMASAASAAPADKPSSMSASIVSATTLAPPANFALQRELIGSPRADDRIVVAQRFRRGRRGRGAGVAAGVALGILGAAALANSARAEPPPGYYGYGPGPGVCSRWDRLCYYGERWACRRLRRECY